MRSALLADDSLMALPEKEWDDWCADFCEADVLDDPPSYYRTSYVSQPAPTTSVLNPPPDLMAAALSGGLRVGQLVCWRGVDCEVIAVSPEGDSFTLTYYTFP